MISQYKKIFSISIKIAIVVFAFWFIYVKIIANNDLKKFISLLNSMPKSQIWTIISIAVALMLINWGLEAIKWKRLIRQIEPIGLWLAIESVFCGLTWAVFTPNRIGEYGGRVFFLSPKRRVVGAVAMTVGTIGQVVLTNFFGAIALCLFIYKFTAIDSRLYLAVCGISVVFCSFFIVFYFNIKWLNGILQSFRFTRKYKKFYAILARYKKNELFKILLFCLARYMVFSTQYYIMLLWLIPELYLLDVMILISVFFFVQASLPSLDIFDVGVRSFTASYFFGFVTTKLYAVIAVTASIWFINLIVPAILGSYFVFKLKFFGSNQRT